MGRRTATVTDPRVRQALAMYERDLENEAARLTADLNQFKQTEVLRYHTHRSQHSPAGFPDDVFVNPRRTGVAATMYWELKRECRCMPGRVQCAHHPTPEQQRWLDTLAAIGHPVYVIRPSDHFSGRMARLLVGFAQGKALAA